MNLKNVTLYAKGWYKKSNDIIEDLKKCLNADDYCPCDRGDVCNILISNLSQTPWLMRNGISYYINDLLSGINPKTCWKIGYYTKNNAPCYKPEENETYPEYDFQTAIIYYYLSILRFMEMKDLGGLPKPSKKVLPLSKNPKTIAEFWPAKEKV